MYAKYVASASARLYDHAYAQDFKCLLIDSFALKMFSDCRGGPTNVDGQKDLASLADRSLADARGVPTTTASDFHRSH